MQYPPPFHGYDFPLYYGGQAAAQEKRSLRKEANALCLLLVGIEAFLLFLTGISSLFLGSMDLQGGSNSLFNGYPPVLSYLAHNAIYIAGLSLPVFFYWAIRGIRAEAVLPFEHVRPLTAVAYVLFGTSICTLSNLPADFVIALEQRMGFSGSIPDLPLNGDPAVSVLFFFAMSVIPPLTEELIFRGAVLQGLRAFGDGFAIVGSAFLFAVYHGNFSQAVFAFPCGLVMAFAVVKTGNLWVSVAIHFLNNGISVALELIQYHMGHNIPALFNYYFVVSVVLGLAALIYLSVRDHSLFNLKRSASLLRPSQKFGTLVWNVGGVILLSLSLISAFYMLTSY